MSASGPSGPLVLNPFSFDTWEPLQQVVYLHGDGEQEWGASVVYFQEVGSIVKSQTPQN